MPLIDLPLSQLETYAGLNPRPGDHEEYWQRALAELASLNPKVELVRAEFQTPFAECFHLYFTGVRGARVHAKYLRPRKAQAKHPAVIEFHGYTGSSGDWSGKLGYLGLGYSLASLDCRGQGGLSEDSGGVTGTTHHGHFIRGLADGPDSLLFRHIFLDTAQLARIVMGFDGVDANRVGALGGSQGGALTLACAALEPRIKRAATWFTRLGYIDIQQLAPRIQAEVLMGVGLMDRVCPPSTQYAAYNRITSPKRALIYPDFGHEQLPGFSDQVFRFLSEL